MGGLPINALYALLSMSAIADMRDAEIKFEAEGACGKYLPRHDGFTHPLERRSRGPQAHRVRKKNRNHVSRRTRRKHRRAA